MNVDSKLSLNSRWMTLYKTNNISLDLLPSPIKNIKKIIKRNTRANSFNSLNYIQTENLLKISNPFLIGAPNFASSSKINLKKNIFNNTKANSKKKHIKAKTRNITVRPSTSDLGIKNLDLIKKKNIKINVANNNKNSFLYKSNDFSGDKNKLLLTHSNNNPKKNQLTISQNNQHQIKIEQIFKSNKKYIDVGDKQKNKKKIRSNKIFTNTNFSSNLGISSDYDQIELFNDYEYNFPKKLQKTKKISKNSRNNLKQFDGIFIDQKTLSIIISENQQIKLKNEELTQKFDEIKNEFELIKKDNKTIKEELKEKTKFLKTLQLTLDVFSKELSKLQNKTSYNVSNTIYNKNNNSIYIHNNSNSKINTKQIKKIQNIDRSKNNSINNTHKNIEKKNIIFSTISKDLFTNKNPSIFNSTSNLKITQLPLSSILKNNKNYNLDNNSSKILCNKETKDTGCTIPSPSGNEEKITVSEKEESESFDFTNISLAENLNINAESYKNAINYCSNQHTRNDTIAENNNDEGNKKYVFGLPKKLNFVKDKIPNDFNDEFLKNLNQFSDSWRKDAEKMIKRTQNKSINIDNSKKE